MKKATFVFCGLAALVIAAAGCSDVKRKPGKVYMPDMAYSRAYETYSTNPVFADGRTNQEPVAGTIKHSNWQYPLQHPFQDARDIVHHA